ncbi:hypothetical protein EV714DRAFT_217251 [Schizophyllum commune]
MTPARYSLEREGHHAGTEHRNSPADPNSAGLFARIRSINGLALNTLASIFTKASPYSPQREEYFDDFGPGDQQHSLSSNRRLSSLFEPRNSRIGKGLVLTSARNPPLKATPFITSSRPPAHSSSASSGSDLDLTPPLTPDIANNESYSFDSLRSSAHSGLGDSYDDGSPPFHSPEVREGKKPERRINEEPPADDFSGFPTSSAASTPAVADDSEEWVGLEYSIELSTRERHISDTLSHASAGEHSKSRESWAALHAGTMHPIVEEEEYARWVNWHRYLDQQEERRRHKKGYAFKAHSREMALLYLEEFRLRDVVYRMASRFIFLHKVVLLTWRTLQKPNGVLKDKLEKRLALVAELRPDPYIPAQKHTDSWYLKRSRTISCLAELYRD